MSKKAFFLAPFIILFLFTGCKKTEIKSQWLGQVINIDGDNSDWENVSAQYLKKPNSSISIANDEQNLYLLFRFSDENLARKILSRGLFLYFDKDKKSGIRYRGNFAIADSLRSRRTRQNQLAKINQHNFPPLGNLGMIAVFNHNERELLRENNDSGLKANASFRAGVFNYEFAIPLHPQKGIPIALAANSNNRVRLGLEIGGIDRETLEKMRQQRQSMGGQGEEMGGRGGRMGGRGGGMGGRGGGMGGRGGSRGGDLRNRPNMAPQEVWLDVQLATDK